MGMTTRRRRTAPAAGVAALACALALALACLAPAPAADAALTWLADGAYEVPVALSGGSGRASIASPAAVAVEGGQATATIVWSSSSYDKMTVAGRDYRPVTTDGGSAFEIPVTDDDMQVKAETTAMGTPHTIDYAIAFDMAGAQKADGGTFPLAVAGAVVVLLATGIVTGVAASRRRGRG